MKDATILRTGIIGSVIAGVCCATPVVVIALGALGMTALIGWVDYVVIPALALFLSIAAYGLWRRQRLAECCSSETQSCKTTPSEEGARHG
ncbi:mercury resistance system transport protein MerF [Mesorhizobium sp. J428]|uniref:mercury resistance system transport protein MerF n=1 Tax=Mesorhizobium sp. J428 TaxID=2898440 RepID=UPI00215148E2|nr:mercury resistance system transport protein MerF [Mesorhizobium sp. J428]MCR5857428.1 mercury resistance system transport protein MerF [Mesorhizobium sp. J428]